MLCRLFRDSLPASVLHLNQKHRHICWVFQSSTRNPPTAITGTIFLPRQSASWAVLVTDAAGRNTLATTTQLIKLQICLFLAAGPEIASSLWLRLQGWWDLSKHLLSIHFKSHIHSGVSFTLSVTCHIRKSFIAKVTKEQLEAKNPQSPLGSVAGIQITQWSWGYIPVAWHGRRRSIWDPKSLS